MLERQADGWPSIRVNLVDVGEEQMRDVAVWLVDVVLFEFLHDHFPLDLKRLGRESKREHPVALKPERRLDVSRRHHDVIIGEINIGEGIVLSRSLLALLVVVRNIDRASEHEMLEKMGESSVFRLLIP